MIPTLLFYKVKVIPSENSYVRLCRGRDWLSNPSRKIFHICLFCLLYSFPLMVVAVLCILIYRKLWPPKIPQKAGISRILCDQEKVALLSKCLNAKLFDCDCHNFCVCALLVPNICQLLFLFIRPEQRHKLPAEVQYLFFWLAHANSAIHPCLYILLNYNFRKRLVSILVRCHCLRCFCCTPN